MNFFWPRFLKSAYRKEPISSFIVLIGAVDAVLGGVNESWSLLTFGLSTVGVAIAIRWWQSQRQEEVEPVHQTAKHYLPPSPSRVALPRLSASKHHPPQ